MQKIHQNILSFILGIPIAIGINVFTEFLFIVDNGDCYEYRFPKLARLLDFFYEGFHHDTNLLNFALTFALGFYIAYIIIKHLVKLKFIK